MNSSSQSFAASGVIGAVVGMVILLVGFPLLPILFISFVGMVLVLGALFVLARAMDSLANPNVSTRSNIAGIILMAVGGLLLIGGMVYATPGRNSILPDYSWRLFGLSWLTSFLITFGIHFRGKLARSQAILIFFYWYLFLPMTFFVVHVYTLMGVDMSGRN